MTGKKLVLCIPLPADQCDPSSSLLAAEVPPRVSAVAPLPGAPALTRGAQGGSRGLSASIVLTLRSHQGERRPPPPASADPRWQMGTRTSVPLRAGDFTGLYVGKNGLIGR